VEHGEHDLRGRPLLLLVHVDGDAAAVVGDRDAVVRVDRDLDVVALTGQGLVDGVVHDLVDEVVKAAGPGGSDVHAGALADGLEALEHGDVLGSVGGAGLGGLLRQINLSFGACAAARRRSLRDETPRPTALRGPARGSLKYLQKDSSGRGRNRSADRYKIPANHADL
jgi:hypothetical protein